MIGTYDIYDSIECTESGHPSLDPWNDHINALSKILDTPTMRVPRNLVKAHILFESGGNAHAVGRIEPLGFGLLQITFGVQAGLYNGEAIMDPYTNIKVGIRDFILPNCRAFPNDIKRAIGAFNAGIGAMQDAIDPQLGTYDPHYIPNVLQAYSWLVATAHKTLGE